MNKQVTLLALVLFLLIALFALVLNPQKVTALFIGFGQPAELYGWWNVSWQYRMQLRVNTTSYDRTDWPIEEPINFTYMMPNGTFDINSIRVIEYNSTGDIVQEVPSQFDVSDTYDAVNNADGMLVFIMNGTTPADAERVFFVYYDDTSSGAKTATSYPNDFIYGVNATGTDVNVTTSRFKFYIDTNRGENTSGIYRIIGIESGFDVFSYDAFPDKNERTFEYTMFSNTTHNLTFNFTDNISVKYNGTARLVLEQIGDEVIWNTGTLTNQGFGIKRYTFYRDSDWIKIEVNYTNTGASSVTRDSSHVGPLTFEAANALRWDWQSGFGNTTNPGWWWAADVLANTHLGIIHYDSAGTSNFYVPDSTGTGHIGIRLNSTTVNSGESIAVYTAWHFNATEGDDNLVSDLRERLGTPANQTLYKPEFWYANPILSTNATIYNRNESVLIISNISTTDPYNLTYYTNATIDMGTPSTADDLTLVLYDDGTHGDNVTGDDVYMNVFNITTDPTIGEWIVNVTTYGQNQEFLSWSTHNFNVTDILNISLDIFDDMPILDSVVHANMDLRNYRQDQLIAGATVNCNYGGIEAPNITDLNNGSYYINFTAPSNEDTFLLECNASYMNNFDQDNGTFTTQPLKALTNVTAVPDHPVVSSVELFKNDSFLLSANATVLTNGTAYAANISLELLQDWDANTTIDNCSDILKYSSCLKGFNVTVPAATSPGYYAINLTVTWKNPDGTVEVNKTLVNVSVLQNPKVNITIDSITSEGADGTTIHFGNFTVLSEGNYNITNITFSCDSGVVCSDFNVAFLTAENTTNITNIPENESSDVSIYLTVPIAYAPGTYSGTINATTQTGKTDLMTMYVILPKVTNVSIIPNIPNYTSYNVTRVDSETFSVIINLTTTQNSSARYSNISTGYDAGWGSNSSFEDCYNLTIGSVCTRHFNITIPNATTPGDYYFNVSANWTDLDGSLGTNMTSILVRVASNPKINLTYNNLSISALDGVETTVGDFIVNSIGNDGISNVQFGCYGDTGEVCDNFTLVFDPTTIGTLSSGASQNVTINVTIPVTFPSGNYSGTAWANTSNDGAQNISLYVEVLENMTWEVDRTYCQRSQQTPQGVLCNINVTNLGNTLINFTMSPTSANYTYLNETNFSIDRSEWHVFAVEYNVTDAPLDVYNFTFTLDATRQGSYPDNQTITTTLLPYIPPIINFTILPNTTQQNDTVYIYANVTGQSASNISWVRLNVTTPDLTVYSMPMFLVNISGNSTYWEMTYPNSTNEDNGSTFQRGLYNVTVYASDQIGNTDNKTKTLAIYLAADISVATLSDLYYQGDMASIYYHVTDISGAAAANVNVSFIVYDSTGNISYLSSNYTTGQFGAISPLPYFYIPSDSPLGYYTLASHSEYADDVDNITRASDINYTFQVLSRTVTVTGVFADLETTVVWYPDNNMTFGILVYNGEGRPVDPTSMNLTVLDPVLNVYLTVSFDSTNNFTRQGTGYYTYRHAMGAGTATGMYYAILNVSQDEFQTMAQKAFRVAQGGPYDVRIEIPNPEAPQGGVLNYNMVVENKGEVTQDVFIEYAVKSLDGATTYATWSEAVLTPALTDSTFSRSIDIYSDQPLGQYRLHATVNYDPVQSPIDVNRTFTVVGPVATTTTTAAPSAPSIQTTTTVTYPTPENFTDILITRYNSNISLARGVTIVESVIVNNTGQYDLPNVSLYLIGIPPSWFNITPETYRELKSAESAIFVITFRAPEDADLDTLRGELIATSGIVSDRKEVGVSVYASLKELLEEEISKLKEELAQLEADTANAKEQGKDISDVELLISEIRDQLDQAETALKAEELNKASSHVFNARNLIEKAKNLLDRLQLPEVEGYVLPFWIVIAIFIIISLIIFAAIFWKRKEAKKMLRPWIIQFGRLADAVKQKKTVTPAMEVEREKVERMLKLLEKEKEEGIISISAYKEMKRSLEEKLKRLE